MMDRDPSELAVEREEDALARDLARWVYSPPYARPRRSLAQHCTIWALALSPILMTTAIGLFAAFIIALRDGDIHL